MSVNLSPQPIHEDDNKSEGLLYLVKRCIPLLLALIMVLLLWLFFQKSCHSKCVQNETKEVHEQVAADSTR